MARPEPVVESGTDELADDDYSFLDPVILTFPNGARVVLNPSELSDDSVVLAASSPGGLSLVADADVPEAMQAVEVVAGSGLGTLDPVQLDTILSASSVELYPYLDATSEGFSGSSTTDDVETMLQVLTMYLEQPRFDQVALDSTIESWLPLIDDPAGRSRHGRLLTYTEARYGGEPRYAAVPTAADLDALDLATIERVWRERFSSPGRLGVRLVGRLRSGRGHRSGSPVHRLADRRRPGARGGGRPAAATAPGDRHHRCPRRLGSEGLAHPGLRQPARPWTRWRAPASSPTCVTGVISNRLTDSVREELGASYSPYGYTSVYTDPDPLIETVVEVTGDPDQIDELTDGGR